ncbi:MAG TPA: PLP-dependent aminotransferase family protein [Nocardioidaceae bacterium]|nr:PLP-dependent aminotransferase family protein [Nocardioidaceae bacterium]
MSDSWATSVSGLDLHLDRSGPRVRAGLEAALREAIREDRLGPGVRVPSSRTLAADLGLARNTVADAYGQLVAEGWLIARQGSGTRVAERAPGLDATPESAPDARRPRYDMRPGSPDVSMFPRHDWLAAARRAAMVAAAETLGYGDPQGCPELRQALAGYLARVRGVHADPGRIVICAGFTQGLGLLARIVRGSGATGLAMEPFGLPDHRAIAAEHGLRVRPTAIDEQGAVTDRLTRAGGVVLTPAHQFPLGMALAPARRTAAIDWAAATGGLVVEDDYDGEFRYDRHPVGAMQALAPDRVVYAGTASKSLAPGLRLGWLVVPSSLVDDVVAAKRLADHGTSVLAQLTLAELVDRGGYDRQVRRARLAYRRRRDRLVAALAEHAPRVRVTGIAAGLHALLELPDELDERVLVELARDHGLAVEGLGAYSAVPGTPTNALVVGYSTPPEHAFTAALARLVATLDEAAS